MDYDYIRENLSNVHENIETACSKSGRDVDSEAYCCKQNETL